MKLTRASEYALHALVYLVQEKPEKPVASHIVAEAQGIPERFLLKVLKPLVSAHVLQSIKGPNGGYRLTKPAKEVTLLEVVEAVDGLDALSKLRGQELDLFLTDINMPRMDGLEFTRRLRALPQYRFVPIVLLTTESHADKKQQGKAAGATAWIVKPFNPDQLLAVVKKVMR